MKPWTRREFQEKLRCAGWKRIPGPAAAYVSPDDPTLHFQMDAYRPGIGILWRYYASRCELPATTRPPF